MNTLEFLERVLPDDGTYCFSTINKQGLTRNIFLATKADIAVSTKAVSGKTNVYHACASYKDGSSRKKTNVHRLKSLWLDVDVRPDKGYRDFESAFRGLADFLSASSLPRPLVVFSGGGLHLYWPLDADIEPERWQKYSLGLETLAKNLGFKSDEGIAKDSARVLRTPGTINLKNGNEAKILNDAGPYNISQFNILLIQNAPRPTPKKKYEKDADINKILARCSQMRGFQSGIEQSGQTWIACGRVIAQCYNGTEELWHEWSSKDDRYSEPEAQKKWEESVAFDNGVTCSHFKSVNPEGCTGCMVWGKIKSPVQLGRSTAISEEVKAELSQDDADVLQTATIPHPYAVGSSGGIVLRDKSSEEEEVKEVEVSRFPFFVLDRTTSELDESQQAIRICHSTPADGWRVGEMTLVEYGTNPIAALAKLGVLVTNEKAAKDFIRRSVNELATFKKMTKVHDTFGWKGDKFLLGDRLYSVANNKLTFETVHLGGDAVELATHLRPGGRTGRGSVQGWRTAAQSLFSKGHEWQAATLLAAAGAPLLALLDDAEGGTIWSLFDPIGGKGKTTATVAGATLWGGWEGLSTNAADTLNARMAKLGTLRHLPLAYDEMRRDNPGIAKQFVQVFTAGTERARLNRTASISRQPRSWRTFMLTSANSELIGAIAADEGSEAMSDRVFEIHAENLPLRKGEINSQLKSEFLNNAGHAGPILLALILKDLDAVKQLILEKEKHYMSVLGDSKSRFRAQLIAVVDVMGSLIAGSNLLVFDPKYYTDWLLEQLTVSSDEIKIFDGVEYLARFIREFQHSIIYTTEFKPGSAKMNVPEPKSGRVIIRFEKDTQHIVIPRKDLEIWLQSKDQSMKAFIKDLESKEIIYSKTVKRTLTAGTHMTSGLEAVIIFRGDHELLSGIEKVTPLRTTQAQPASSPLHASHSR